MTSKKYDIVVVGATGLVGETMMKILEERKFPVERLYPVASEQSAGETVIFKGRKLTVEPLEQFDFGKAQIGFFSAGGAVSEVYAPVAASTGCVVIDNTSYFRYEPEVPLVIPEVNGGSIGDYKNKGIIANPNCSTIQMLVALKPVYDAVGITRINVSTYQSVSGAGKKGITELASQAGQLLNGVNVDADVFTAQIAFNAIPHIDQFETNGYTREEMKMVWETHKILDDKGIRVNPTCVRISAFFGHAEAVHIETVDKISANEVTKLLENAPGVTVMDKRTNGGYPTQVSQATGNDNVFAGRIRDDISCEKGINLWLVADNIRKGAALNSIQIAEQLISDFLEC